MVARLSKNPIRRMADSLFGQSAAMRQCPDLPLLKGQVALVTGASGDIGRETVRGLMQRGALVVGLCRDVDKATELHSALEAEGLDGQKFFSVIADLACLDEIVPALAEVRARLRGRKINILIENAGQCATRYDQTADGIEMNFATNVLGHFALRRGLMDGMLAAHARIIVLTDEAYIRAKACGPHFRFRTRLGGVHAYNRSKLGNIWIARELQRRQSNFNVYIVHPGVVASHLADQIGGVMRRVNMRRLISPEEGAQTSLMCATQNNLSHGSYYHNVHGEVELDNADPAMNDIAASQLWESCMQMTDAAFTTVVPINRVA